MPSAFGSLFDKIKHFVGQALNVGEADAHVLAEAALPVFEHFEEEIVALVKTAVAEAKGDVTKLADALRPIIADELKKVLQELGIGSTDTPQPDSSTS
jgi:predicted RNA-binding Zn ribbon-like protein